MCRSCTLPWPRLLPMKLPLPQLSSSWMAPTTLFGHKLSRCTSPMKTSWDASSVNFYHLIRLTHVSTIDALRILWSLTWLAPFFAFPPQRLAKMRLPRPTLIALIHLKCMTLNGVLTRFDQQVPLLKPTTTITKVCGKKSIFVVWIK